MEIQKRTMNWLPRASLYDEAEANRVKRKANSEAAISQADSSYSLMSTGVSNTTEAVNLTLRIAAARVQSGVKVKV